MPVNTLRECLEKGSETLDSAGVFFGHGTDNADDEAVEMLNFCLGEHGAVNEENIDDAVPEHVYVRFTKLLQRRCEEKIPLPYLTGRCLFAGLSFDIDTRALIPRSPLAELVERGFEPWIRAGRVQRVLDLCTGSGCIGVAAAYYLPHAYVCLADISTDALALARQNIDKHSLASRVSCRQSDLFSAFDEGERYDVIVSNPPYVDAEDWGAVPAEYLHEPVTALRAGDDGLHFVHLILARVRRHLTEQGVLICEVGNSAGALTRAYPDLPFIWLDFARGGHGVFLLENSQLPL